MDGITYICLVCSKNFTDENKVENHMSFHEVYDTNDYGDEQQANHPSANFLSFLTPLSFF